MRFLLVLATLVMLLAAPAMAQAPPEDPDPSITDGSAQAALDAAKERWADAGVRDYSFKVSLRCFCAREYTKAAVIVVRDGHPHGKVPRRYRAVATVARQFRRIQDAIDEGVAGLSVVYAARGRPQRIDVNPAWNIVDEEVGYTFGRFRAGGGS